MKEELTARKMQIAKLVANGLNDKQIGLELGITANAVQGHLVLIYAKLGVYNRVELTIYLLQTKVLKLEDIRLGGVSRR